MPLDTPQTSTGDTTWIVNGQYKANSNTTFKVAINVESSAAEAEGDALLQELVDLLNAHYPNVVGFKGYNAYTTRTMDPSS